ncbi:hypothetical protein SNE40_008027 [Patella caerulea]|uniref:C2 domain-containing protein n=1 Tax=Patella caerulea TaxID=87958 RepID=A0AAN8K0B7_PATCE
MMADHDMIPVRDLNIDPAGQMRRMVNKWQRDELEDKYLRNYEENIILKKHARKQEEKIKKMATKLLRLVNDRKKLGGDASKLIGDDRIMNDDVIDKMKELEKQNHLLKDKLVVAKQQIATLNQRVTGYEYVQARIDTGIPHRPGSPTSNIKITRNIRVAGPSQSLTQKRRPHSPTMHYQQTSFEDIQMKKRMEQEVGNQREQIDIYKREIQSLHEQIRKRESEFQQDMSKVQHQMTADHKVNLKENVDLIKLQREISSKSSKIMDLESKYARMEENMHIVKSNRDEMLMEMERLNYNLKEEQNKVLTLQNEIRNFSAKERKLYEIEEKANALERDNEILKEANEKLVSSAFDLEREREWRQRENQLKVQIAQLEATMKADLGEKGSIIDRYSNERESNEKLQSELREVQINYYQIKEQYDDLQEKMKFFTRESGVDFTEIEEALVLIKQKRQREIKKPEFLQQVDEEKDKDYKKSLLELQAEYAETVHELEKTRNMLVVQHKINKDYQLEVDSSNQRMDEVKKEYEMKLEEYARLLDIRAARIKKLEHQMKDVAYGTRQYKIPVADSDMESTMDLEESISLERGQNLFEIHIHKLNLSPDALRLIGDEEPSLFCTWEFFEFEIQSTPVVRGPRPVFDFTSQYVVKVDDFFLHYLQKEACTLELHQSFGQDFRTISACRLIFRDIFDKQHGRIHGVASLTGVGDEEPGVGYGTVEYWIRLRVPMEQALRLYKERTKALGYMTHNDQTVKENLKALDDAANTRPMDNVNKLDIKIKQCSRLKSRRENVQPSPYCVYRFFDFGDHDTAIIPNSNQPVFNDHRSYPVSMTSELDQYLRQEHLQIFVFDDTDPEESNYIGMVDVPLLSLANNKSIDGPFDLKASDGTNSGLIELELSWQYSYMSTRSGTRHQPMEVTFEKEESTKAVQETPHAKSRLAARFTNEKGPSATSTPFPKAEKPIVAETPIKDVEISAVQPLPAPTPVARKKLIDDKSESKMVDETVTDVVVGFMPDVTDSMSTTTKQYTETVTSETTISRSILKTSAPERPETDEDQEIEDEIEEVVEEEIIEAEDEEIEEETPVPSPTPSPPSRSSPLIKQRERKSLKKPKPKMRSLIFNESLMSKSPKPSPKPSPKDSPRSVSSLRSKNEEEEMEQGNEVKISESESEPPKIETDSEGVVIRGKVADRRRIKDIKKGNTVIIVVSNLSLEEDSNAAQNDNINRLYVGYRFLGLPADETETPYSLPKPRNGKHIQFNFSKTIQVDLERNYDRRQKLAAMLLPSDPDKGRLRFEVISEPPPTDKDGECEDVGVAFVSIPDILHSKKNIKDEDLDIYDFNDEKTIIGNMKVTVECLAALEAIDKELVEGTF